MICQYKIELQSKIKRERITTFSRENVRENNKKVIENNMRRKKVKKKNSNKYQIIQFILCYVIK